MERIQKAPANRLIPVAHAILARRWLVIIPSILGAVYAGAHSLLRPRSYTTMASFQPETGATSLASYAMLAAQFGVQIPTGDNSDPPEFYVHLLESDALLGRVADSRINIPGDRAAPTPLSHLLGVSDPPGNERKLHTIRELQRATLVRYDARSGLISLQVRTHSPTLSSALADSLLAEVDWYNRAVRKTQASNEREFTQGRLAVSQDDLTVAENAYRDFLERNRYASSSPTLAFEAERLQREVADRTQLVASLRQAYEQARLNEVRNTPLISIIEAPAPPLAPDSRNTIVYTGFGALAGGVFGVILALAIPALFASDTKEQLPLRILGSELRKFGTELRRPTYAVREAMAEIRSLRHTDVR